MKKTILFSAVCTLAIANVDITVADDHSNSYYHDHDVRSGHSHLGTVAIPCIRDEMRFSCSNKSPRRSLDVVDATCFVGAGENPEVLSLDNFRSEVAPETTEVVPINCGEGPVRPVFCTAWVSPRKEARCALTWTGGLNAELK